MAPQPSINLGLSRILSLLASLKNPHLATPIVHIAGTNGKGSVSAYLSSILQHSALRVGRFNSPHLVDEWDALQIGGTTISERAFREANDEVLRVDKETGCGATSFEILAATAFEVFARARPKLDLAVVEVGMGGETDATNVVDAKNTLLSIVTSIELDHQKFLGSTVREIARVKTGIAKEGGDVVLAKQAHQEVEQVLNEVAKERNATVWIAGEGMVAKEADAEHDAPLVFISTAPLRTTSYASSAPTNQSRISVDAVEARLPLPGSYQLANSAAATLAANVLSTSPRALSILPSLSLITKSTIVAGIESTRWPGRLDWLTLSLPVASPSAAFPSRRQHKILLDGAHNPSSATSLALYLDSLPPHLKPTTLILALSAPRPASAILTPLLFPPSPLLPSTINKIIAVTFTEPPSMPWIKPVSTEEIVSGVKELGPDVEVESCKGGVREALEGLAEGERVVSSTSFQFYLGPAGNDWGSVAARTPGLISQCGDYAICKLLLATVALGWLTFLTLGTLFTLLLLSTLYYSIRRKSHLISFITPFHEVEWDMYAHRLPRGTGAPAPGTGEMLRTGLSLRRVERKKSGREVAAEREKREMEKAEMEEEQEKELEIIVGDMTGRHQFENGGQRDSRVALFD
ncbi:hypothetical protein P7C70_g2958, partial [Phenoliferia sp. Uapishka_3]